MNFSKEQLNEIEQLSGLFFFPEEIALLMDIDVEKLKESVNKIDSMARKNYLLGRLKTQKIIRENVIKMAKNGSPAAEELSERYLKEHEIKERNYARKTRFDR